MRNTNKRVFYSTCAENTVEIGREIGAKLKDNDIVGVKGGLGAGKTLLARGIVREILKTDDDPVRSPTFTIMNVYSGADRKVFHFDLYRITDMNDLESTGYREFSSSGGITLIEWPDRIEEVMKDCNVIIEILEAEEENSRTVSLFFKT